MHMKKNRQVQRAFHIIYKFLIPIRYLIGIQRGSIDRDILSVRMLDLSLRLK